MQDMKTNMNCCAIKKQIWQRQFSLVFSLFRICRQKSQFFASKPVLLSENLCPSCLRLTFVPTPNRYGMFTLKNGNKKWWTPTGQHFHWICSIVVQARWSKPYTKFQACCCYFTNISSLLNPCGVDRTIFQAKNFFTTLEKCELTSNFKWNQQQQLKISFYLLNSSLVSPFPYLMNRRTLDAVCFTGVW